MNPQNPTQSVIDRAATAEFWGQAGLCLAFGLVGAVGLGVLLNTAPPPRRDEPSDGDQDAFASAA